jgi:DNA sulfur modification protein DndD
LYGHTDFDTGEKTILNELALSNAAPGATVELRVELHFEHEGAKYSAVRKQEYRRETEKLASDPIGKSTLELSWVDSSGKFNRSPNPGNQINQILPEKMHSYFFFNGERIEKLSNVSAAGEIRDAIRTLMGLEIVERASDHLRRIVIKELRKEASESASSDYRTLAQRNEELQNQKEGAEARRATAIQNKAGFQAELDAINDSYGRIVEVREKTAQRKQLEEQSARVSRDLDALRRERMDLVARVGALAFLDDGVNKTADRLEDCRKKGELPYKIRRTFVDDLLAQEACICGTPLTPGSTERAHVEGYRDKATGEDLEAAFTEMVSNLRAMPRERERLYDQLRAWSDKEAALTAEAREVTGKLDEISSTLASSEIEDVKKLEQRRQQLAELQSHEQTSISKSEDEIKDLDERLSELKKEIDKIKSQSEKEDIARRRLEFAEECKKLIDQLHEALAEETRKHLSERVNRTFQSILRKDFWAEVDDDYTLKIFKTLPGLGKQAVSEKSTGENQVTSLSFIASLVSLAKDRRESKGDFFKGGVFPIVMDSPFGALDREYREKIAEHIPQLADQVIIFASNSQWSREVDEKCRPFIGKEYSLVYHAPKRGGQDQDSEYVKRTDGPEFTKIEEGYLGRKSQTPVGV